MPPRIYEHEYMAMQTCRHGVFLYNHHDTFISKSLDYYGEWCEGELHALSKIIKPGDVVIDVGANIGTHTVFFAKAVTNKGLVFAFEPQRLVFQNLCANIALNALNNVVARQQGVGMRTGTVALPVLDPRRDINFGAVFLQGHAQGEPVEVIRIDDLQLNRCNLMKVDVEGMECDVLEGAKETITRCRPVLFVENDTLERSAVVITILDLLGYDAYWHICNYFNPDNYYRNPKNIFANYHPEANLLCFHRSYQVQVHGLVKAIGAEDNWQKALTRRPS